MSLVGGVTRWGTVLGPVLAGVMLQFTSVRLCLLLQIPFAVIAAVAVVTSHQLKEASLKLVWAAESRAVGGATGFPWDLLWKTRSTVVPVAGFACIVMAARSGRRFVIPMVALNLGMSPAMVGSVVGAGFLVDASFFWVAGIVNDRVGRRCTAVPVALLTAVAYSLLAVVSTVPWFIVSVLFFGVADTLGAGVLLTLIADVSPREGGSLFFGALGTMKDSGTVIGPLMIGFLMHHHSVSAACLALASLCTVAAAVAALSPAFDAVPQSKPAGGASFAAIPDTESDAGESEMAGPSAGVAEDDGGASVDLELDDEDLALFNAVHPGAQGQSDEL